MSGIGAVAVVICVICVFGYGKIILGGHDDDQLWLGVLAYVLFLGALFSAGIVGMDITKLPGPGG